MSSRISELATIIARDTAIVEDFCKKSNVPTPSFDVNAPPTVFVPPGPEHAAVATAQDNVISATRELSILMRGPQGLWMDIGHVDAFVFRTISRFKIASHVPIDGEISFAELAKRCGANMTDLRRVMRFAMTDGYFRESKPDHVAHTSFSKALGESWLNQGGFAFTYEECFPACARATDALDHHNGSEEPTLSGWGLANSATQPLFTELQQKYPSRHNNARIAMDAWNSWVPNSPLVDNFPWNEADLVVDVGGGHGPVSLSIAKSHPRPKFVVQELAPVVAEGPSHIPAEFKERISFAVHDMFEEQPVQGADVYLYRSVFHDWPDKYCVRMLKALVPALKPGARVVINDQCMPPPGILPPTPERTVRTWDLSMMVMFNARDREAGDWGRLFEEADPRFKFLGARVPSKNVDGIPPTFLLSIIEAVWEP